jgi:hypothetical protein
VTRNILTICGGIILSFLLVSFSGWFLYNFSEMSKIARVSVSPETKMLYREVENSMYIGFRIIEFGIFPAGSILIGIYVSLLTKKNEVIFSAASIFPLLIFSTSTKSSRLEAFAFSVLYLSLCCFTTYFISKWKVTRRTASQIISNHEDAPDQEAVR